MRWRRDARKALKYNTLCELELDQLESPVACTQRYYNQILMDHKVNLDHVLCNDHLDWVLVQSGRPTNECGSMTRVKIACPEKDHTSRAIKISCHRKVCPECGPAELKITTSAAVERIQAFEKEFKKAIKQGYFTYRTKYYQEIHLMISPPKKIYDRFYTKNGYQNICRYLGKLLRMLGVIAAYKITHQFRDDPETGLLDTSEDSWHFHLIAVLPYKHLVDYEDFIQRTGGWLYKNIDEENKRKGDFRPRSLEDTIYYQLSHASITEYPIVREGQIVQQHGHIATWFNKISYNNFHKIEDVDRRLGKHENCEKCGTKMHEYYYSDAIKEYVDQGVYVETLKFWTYYFDERQLSRLTKNMEEYRQKFIKKMNDKKASGDAP